MLYLLQFLWIENPGVTQLGGSGSGFLMSFQTSHLKAWLELEASFPRWLTLYAWQFNSGWLHKAQFLAMDLSTGQLEFPCNITADVFRTSSPWEREDMQRWSHNACSCLSRMRDTLSPPHYFIHWKLITKSSPHARGRGIQLYHLRKKCQRICRRSFKQPPSYLFV